MKDDYDYAGASLVLAWPLDREVDSLIIFFGGGGAVEKSEKKEEAKDYGGC